VLWDDPIRTELAERRAADLERRLRWVESSPEPRVRMDGREMLVLGSNNYLGLATHPHVVAAAEAATRRYGSGSGGSRLTTGNLALYSDLEMDLARIKGTDAAVVFSSGYAANTGTIPALVGEGDLILSDALNHASLIDGCRLSRAEKRVYAHGDPDHIAFSLRDRNAFRRVLIVTDGVFSMDGDIVPLDAVCALAEEFSAGVLLDDAHGLGTVGPAGFGTAERFGLTDHPALLQMGTLSKALGALGGYVASSHAVVELLRQKARSLVFSTGLPPAALAAARESLTILQSSPELVSQLRSNSSYLRSELRRHGFRVPSGETPIVPLLIGPARDAVRLAEACERRGLLASAIRPPTVPEGTSRLRLSVMATHTAEDLAKAVETLVASARETGVF